MDGDERRSLEEGVGRGNVSGGGREHDEKMER